MLKRKNLAQIRALSAFLCFFILSSLSASGYAQTTKKTFETHLLHLRCTPDCWQALQKKNTPQSLRNQLRPLQSRLAAVRQKNIAILWRHEKNKPATAQVLAVQTASGSYFSDGSPPKMRFYSRDGKSLQAQMDRVPLRGKYVMTSGFNPKRRHPITKKIRPHYGVDWHAPRGTPVYSTADGIVEFSGKMRGYGNIVIIKHANQYESRYAHLQRLRVHKGQSVKRGQIIGSVGSTGMSTAVHLHYEVRIAGKPYDPLKVKLPGGKSLPSARLKKWKSEVQKRSQDLERLKKKIPAS